ncbi:MAG: transcription antitermination factor NusB [Ignavibacteriae bacterium]|nr:transcription antitermination factor NusB [Ignavibacteriota bacterium]MCI0707941.1 transcription antitermination factor NusB [Ignavibacteriota bacterium]
MAFKRRLVREKVLQALYAYELSGEPVDFVVEHILASLEKERETFEFAAKFVKAVIEHSDEIDGIIRGHVEHWEFSRLAIIDKLILRMGICELLYYDDIPPKVSINESIEIARLYSTEKSDKFVNGVLDAILSDLTKSGKLKKSGRGLQTSRTQQRPPKQ